MDYTILFPDGRMVGAGQAGSAISDLRLTKSAFSGQNPDPGSVCAAELEAEFIDEGLTLTAGQELKLYQGDALLGTYYAEKPTTPAPGRRRVLAYDSVTKLDTDLSDWLLSLSDWPYTLESFAHMVAQACGLTLTGDLVNADYLVQPFQGRGVTGRQLMQWVCQAGCRFCRAEPDGTLRLGWIADSGIALSPQGENFYFAGMEQADYSLAPIDGVQISLTAQDVGVQHPENAQNALCIRGNYLLSGCDESTAQNILEALGDLNFTPCTLETTTTIAPGEVFQVDGFTALAMTVEDCLGRYRVTCTGTATRTDASNVVRSDYRALNGRILELDLGLQGVNSRMAEFSDSTVAVSRLTQDVSAITGRVSTLETDQDDLGRSLEELSQSANQQFAQLELRSDGMEISVGQLTRDVEGKADAEAVQSLTEHFRFGEDGLTISDSATGMSVRISQEQVAFTGTTVITPNRMDTTRLGVGERLDLGDFSFLPRTNGNLSFRYTASNG